MIFSFLENIPRLHGCSEPEVCYDDESNDEKEDNNQRTYDQMWPPLPKTKENIQSDEEVNNQIKH